MKIKPFNCYPQAYIFLKDDRKEVKIGLVNAADDTTLNVYIKN